MTSRDAPATAEGTLESVIEDLKTLKKKRAYFKRSLTILQQYLAGPANAPDYSGKIVGQFAICQKSMNTCDEYLENIYEIEHENKFDDAFNEKAVNDATFYNLKTQVDLLIAPPSRAPLNGQSQVIQTTVKLPRADLPTFSGNFTDWLSFRERFDSLIHSNHSLADIEKMQYLTSALKGEAADAIKHLQITNDNYEKARELLKVRFENKRVIVNNHIRALYELAPATKESYNGFRNILNTVTQHTHSLKVMGRKVDQDDILVYLIVSKLPFHTRKEWEEKLPSTQLPTYQDIIDFLTQKCHTLEALNLIETHKQVKPNTKQVSLHANAGKSLEICNLCGSNSHFSNQCPDLLNLSINSRIEKVRSKRLCLNCLRNGHLAKDCKSSRCKTCNRLHNTVLHADNAAQHEPDSSSTKQLNPVASMQAFDHYEGSSSVILSTCIVEIRDAQGNYRNACAMLDSGSQINIIRKELAESLKLKNKVTNLPIVGIDNHCTKADSVISANIRSKFLEFSVNLDFYILDNIATNIPTKSINANAISVPRNVQLADPYYYESRQIDLLIGAQIFFQLLCIGQIRTSQPGLVFQKSVFGWLISGAIRNSTITNNTPVSCHLSVLQALNDKIEKFWEIENISESIQRSIKETECEEHFTRTIKRDSTGRFIACLPWKFDRKLLGNSLEIAKKRFLTLERKLLNDRGVKVDYDAFIQEYLELGHMTRVGPLEGMNNTGYFLPHHAVYKPESSTTKIRVAFDASSKTTTNQSLNDALMVRPVIQDDIFSILIRFRLHKYVLSADISKMYRQILVDSNDSCYQKILYRFSADEPIMIHELKTLTYGTRPASFIATRCLKELASQVGENNRLLSESIARDFYMDDSITGSDDINELMVLRNEVITLLEGAGFSLRKWVSNNKELLSDLDSRETHLVINCKESESLKTLGISWSPVSDTLEYRSNVVESSRTTKRTILSSIAQIFDPLGLLGPVIVLAKTIMQELWKLKSSWDASVPLEIHTRWKQFTNELQGISHLFIPRQLISHGNSRLELHGFADASERAYGACVYLREIRFDKSVTCKLICAKSRIAPLQIQSIPRLELCAALLLADLVHKILGATKGDSRYEISNVTYYSDSTISLCWINACPSRWKTFVATRVAKIQRNSNAESWCHVATHENPADVLSRGCFPEPLAANSLWWNSPDFLVDSNFKPKPIRPNPEHTAPEAKVLIAQTQGTNFVGAANEMREILRFLNDPKHENTVVQEMASQGIAWHFNIPQAPHMGGLWEAAVKAFKRHFYKISKNAQLTFSEMYTLFTEIECVLNSRPLTPMPPDPNDLAYLTPGHFLVGDYSMALPEVDLLVEKTNSLSRWQYVQRLQQEFWLRWSKDYLQQLQTRQKWRRSEGPVLQRGDSVLVREDNAPSRHWQLGRILETHAAADGIIRSATIKTMRGVYKRPVVRLSVLPTEA